MNNRLRGEAPNETHKAAMEPGLVFSGWRLCSPAVSDFFAGVYFRSECKAGSVWSRSKAARDEDYECWENVKERKAGSTLCKVRNRQDEEIQGKEIREIGSGDKVEERTQNFKAQGEETEAQQIQKQVTEAVTNQEPTEEDTRNERTDEQKLATIIKQISSKRKKSESSQSQVTESNAKPIHRYRRIGKLKSRGTEVKVRWTKSGTMKVKNRKRTISTFLTLNRRKAELSKYFNLKRSRELVSKLRSVQTVLPDDSVHEA